MRSRVPAGWRSTTLGSVAKVIMGQSPPSQLCNVEGRGLPFFQGNAEFGDVHPSPKAWIEQEFKVAEPRDILLSVRAPVGELNRASQRSVIGRGLAAVRATEALADHLFHTLSFSRRSLESQAQGSTFDAINGADLRGLPILLPPLPEQKKIAAILSSVDEAIQATQAVIEQTQRVKEGLLQDLLTKGIGHTRFKQTKIGEIPESWEVVRVGDSLSIENTRRKPISQRERGAMQGPYPYWGPTKVLDHLSEYAFDGEYALIGEDGDHFLKFRDKEMTRWATGRFNVNNHAHVVGDGQRCLARWFFYFFMHVDLLRAGALTRQGAGRYKLTKAALSGLRLALPTQGEQRALIEILDGVRSSVTPLRATARRLQTLKAGLLQDLLTGTVRVSV